MSENCVIPATVLIFFVINREECNVELVQKGLEEEIKSLKEKCDDLERELAMKSACLEEERTKIASSPSFQVIRYLTRLPSNG